MFRIFCLVAVLASPCFSQVTANFVWTGSEFNLVIDGTESNDQIIVLRQNDFVTVIADGQTIMNNWCTNTPLITIDTYGGDDEVYIMLPPGIKNQLPINVGLYEIHLGNGNDFLYTNSNPGYDPSLMPIGKISAWGESGNDHFDISDVPGHVSGANSPMYGGPGDDRFDYRVSKPMNLSGGGHTNGDEIHFWVQPLNGKPSYNYIENEYNHY